MAFDLGNGMPQDPTDKVINASIMNVNLAWGDQRPAWPVVVNPDTGRWFTQHTEEAVTTLDFLSLPSPTPSYPLEDASGFTLDQETS